MSKRKNLPVALTIAGSDSGGGAGVQADLKTFAALGVHGASAIACLTAQNPECVLHIEPCSPQMLRRQIEAVFEELPPAAVKTGMLFSVENVRLVAEFFARPASPSPRPCGERDGVRGFECKKNSASSPEPSPPFWRRGRNSMPPLVLDPVLISTSRAQLLEPTAIRLLKEQLLPLAALVTPNLDETEVLIGCKPASIEEMRAAAKEIHSRFGCAALVKGGHLKNSREAADIFFDGKTELLLTAPFVKDVRTHGTGCIYSATICAALALGHDLPHAVRLGKEFVASAIASSYRVGNHFALGIW